MKIAYCDCFSGISGDMFLAAMLDAGLPEIYLQEQLDLIRLSDGFKVLSRECKKGALRARKLAIEFDQPQESDNHHHHHRRQNEHSHSHRH